MSDINNYFEIGIKPIQQDVRYRKKKASDTALPGETPFKGTVISNADEANILKIFIPLQGNMRISQQKMRGLLLKRD